MIYIQKKMKPKDAIRVNSVDDIPEELKDTIRIENDKIICLSAEGEENPVELGSVIGIDRKAPTSTGKGAWVLGEGSFTEDEHGVFWPAKDVRAAEYIEGPYENQTKYGLQILKAGERGFLTVNKKGSKNILNMETSSFNDYDLCTKDGKSLMDLREFVNLVDSDYDYGNHRDVDFYNHTLSDKMGSLPGQKQNGHESSERIHGTSEGRIHGEPFYSIESLRNDSAKLSAYLGLDEQRDERDSMEFA